MCEIRSMSKGLKEVLTVLIVTHVDRVKSGVCSFYENVYTNTHSVLHTCPLREGSF